MRSSEKEKRLRRLETQKGLRDGGPKLPPSPIAMPEPFDTPEEWSAWAMASHAAKIDTLHRLIERGPEACLAEVGAGGCGLDRPGIRFPVTQKKPWRIGISKKIRPEISNE